MKHCVVTLLRRAPGADAEAFHREVAERERALGWPAGCTRRAHAQAVARAYRQGDPLFDAMQADHFDELAAAQAWRAQRAGLAPPAGERVDTLLVRMVPIVEGPADHEAGQGLRHVELLRRRASLDRPAFLAYWREVHGPLAAAIPTVRRYLQLPCADGEYAQGEPAFDGLAVLWFDSTESMREGAGHPAFAATREDLPRLVDEARSGSVLTQPVWEARAPCPAAAGGAGA